MAGLRRVTEEIYWSGCPSRYTLERAKDEGVQLVVNLTYECTDYSLPEGMKLLHYPIPDFGFVPPEDFLLNVVIPLSEYILEGEKVLIHCVGGIGRSGTAVAMLLVYFYGFDPGKALDRVYGLGGGPQSAVQEVAFRWFSRLAKIRRREALVELLKFTAERFFGAGVEHASTVANISLDVLEVLEEKYEVSEKDKAAAYVGGLLHDIAKKQDDARHHVLGAEIAKKLDIVDELADRNLVSKVILHHRRKTDMLGDEELVSLGEGAVLSAAAVRLADAFKSAYIGEGTYWRTTLKDDVLSVAGIPSSVNRFKEKSEALSRFTGLKVELDESALRYYSGFFMM